MRGFGTHMQVLGPWQRVEPQGNAPIAVVIDGVRRKSLAANPEIGRAMRYKLLGFGQPEACIPHGLMKIGCQNTPRANRPLPMLQ